MKILQQNLNRSTFVVWEMKKNVSVVCVCTAPIILISGNIIKEMPGLVASGTHCIKSTPHFPGMFSSAKIISLCSSSYQRNGDSFNNFTSLSQMQQYLFMQDRSAWEFRNTIWNPLYLQTVKHALEIRSQSAAMQTSHSSWQTNLRKNKYKAGYDVRHANLYTVPSAEQQIAW